MPWERPPTITGLSPALTLWLVGPASKLLGYTETPDPVPTKPYMMWAGTPYERAMVPVAAAN
jgi:hypothetical protein